MKPVEEIDEFPIVNFLIEFLALTDLTKRNKKQGNNTFKTYLLNLRRTCKIFSLLFTKKDRTIQECVRFLKLTKTEYQKLFEENKILKEKTNTVEMKRQIKKKQ